MPVEKTIVLFRKRFSEITAVFPYLPWDSAASMTCYVHVGQHGACEMAWYHKTKAASPAEYADLKAELERYGSDESDHYVLDVRKRMPADAIKRRRAEIKRMDDARAPLKRREIGRAHV